MKNGEADVEVSLVVRRTNKVSYDALQESSIPICDHALESKTGEGQYFQDILASPKDCPPFFHASRESLDPMMKCLLV